MKLVNLTSHSISLIDEEGAVLTVQPSGKVARLDEKRKQIGFVQGIVLYEKWMGGGNIPEPASETYFLVSLPVAQSHPDRDDLVVADDFTKDRFGHIIGAKALARIVHE